MTARERRAEDALRAAGFSDAGVSSCGQHGDIAAVRLAPQRWEELLGPEGQEAVRAVKALGFRYVALDLETGSGA